MEAHVVFVIETADTVAAVVPANHGGEGGTGMLACGMVCRPAHVH